MKRLLCLCCLLLCCSTSDAGWRRSYFSAGWYPASAGYGAGWYSAGWYDVYYQDQVIVAAFVPVIAYQPTAFATYQPIVAAPAVPLSPVAPVAPAPAAPAAPGCYESLKAMEVRLKAMEVLLASPPQALPGKAAPQAAPVANGGLAVLVTRCGKCHEEKAAENGGGGLMLLKGNAAAELSAVQLLKVYKQLLSGKMPKDGKLQDNEGSLLMQYLDSVKEKP